MLKENLHQSITNYTALQFREIDNELNFKVQRKDIVITIKKVICDKIKNLDNVGSFITEKKEENCEWRWKPVALEYLHTLFNVVPSLNRTRKFEK